VCRALERAGHRDADLLAAALLHDVGKSRAHLRLWERIVVVLGSRYWPRLTERLYTRSAAAPDGARGLGRGAVVQRHHAAWGSDMIRAAGSSARTADLVSRHHDGAGGDALLAALQAADES
jgi:putative nucleotidyltransferase with HDIG domain